MNGRIIALVVFFLPSLICVAPQKDELLERRLDDDEDTPKDIVMKFFEAALQKFDVETAFEYLGEKYIQHNPGVPDGPEPLRELIPLLEKEKLKVKPHRFIEDGDLVAIHSTYKNAALFGAKKLVVFDVFRVEDGLVVEHWDNLQPLAMRNPSNRTMTGGRKTIKHKSQTEENKELVEDFVKTVLIDGDGEKIADYVNTKNYKQHNPDVGDGLDALLTALGELAEADMAFVYETLHLVVAEGDMILTASEGTFGADNPTAFYDLFRVKRGKIVEHWDVISSIPPEDEFENENGKF